MHSDKRTVHHLDLEHKIYDRCRNTNKFLRIAYSTGYVLWNFSDFKREKR